MGVTAGGHDEVKEEHLARNVSAKQREASGIL